MSSLPLSPGKVYKYVKVVQVAKPNISTTPHLVPVRVISSSALQSHQSPRVQIITEDATSPLKSTTQPTTPVKFSATPAATTPLPMNARIKIELNEELTVDCRLCTKSFYNPIALKNHVANMHFGVEADINDWCIGFYEEQKKMQEQRAADAAAAQAAIEAAAAAAAEAAAAAQAAAEFEVTVEDAAEVTVEDAVEETVPRQKKMTPRSKPIKIEIDEKEAAEKKAMIVANMKPISMDAIVKEEFNYLLIKPDDEEYQQVEDVDDLESTVVIGAEENKSKRRRKRRPFDRSDERPGKLPKSKEGHGIAGPFECLEPSNVNNGDGFCHQIFFTCCDYSIHFRDEHTRRRKFIRCQVCEKLLLNGNDEFKSPYTCETCGAGYDTHKDLIEHSSRAHIKIKPFQCPICSKRFTQMSGLNQHLRMHRGERPFPCTFCDKAFTQKSGLEQHMRIHTKEKPYKCVICTKAFKQSIHLKQHMRTHTNLAPFQCLVCQKRFKQASHLNYHFKYHSEDTMTEEQKDTYKSLMEAMQSSIYQVEVDGEGNEVIVNEHISEEAINEQNEAIEHVIVESDQLVIEDDREYILSDNGDETWSVKVVDRVDGN